MLYDSRWDKTETKADPFTLESLIAWLEKQPVNEGYAWHCQGECLLGRWLKSIDPKSCESADGDTFQYFVNGDDRDFVYFAEIALDGLPTFGAALERARAAASHL